MKEVIGFILIILVFQMCSKEGLNINVNGKDYRFKIIDPKHKSIKGTK